MGGHYSFPPPSWAYGHPIAIVRSSLVGIEPIHLDGVGEQEEVRYEVNDHEHYHPDVGALPVAHAECYHSAGHRMWAAPALKVYAVHLHSLHVRAKAPHCIISEHRRCENGRACDACARQPIEKSVS
jgi:hypothetical protein